MSPKQCRETMDDVLASESRGTKFYQAIEHAICVMDEHRQSKPTTGRPCWYTGNGHYEYVEKTRTFFKDPWIRGTFHCFGQDHQEFESGPGPFPIAIIEDVETHHVKVVHAANVSFAEEIPV